MVQKESLVTSVDKSGVSVVNVFHVYNRRIGTVGSFLKTSVRRVLPDAKLKLKNKIIAIFVRSKFRYIKHDGSGV